MPNLFTRLGQAARHVVGLQQRNILPPDAILTSRGYGVPALFDTDASI